jgi:carbamoyl-phosphate synthase large subunit
VAGRVKRALVTGGAGVIGRELIERLAGDGAAVMCADLKPQPDWMPADTVYVEGDANELTLDAVAEFDPDCCFHLAATFERTEETEGFWAENQRHNVELSHHVATLGRELPGLSRMVFASSYLVYDPDLYLFDAAAERPTPLRESDPVRPRNLCGGAKLMHEQELAFLRLFEGTPFSSVAARIFRVYGRGSQDVVSRWVRALTEDASAPLTAYRIEGMFDYVFAGDVAEGLLRLAATDAIGAVNLGSGRARRVAELLELLADRFPGAAWTEEPSDIPFEAHQADVAELERITGWRPPTALEDGLAILADYEARSLRAARIPR